MQVEDQAGVTYAISPISFKLSQFVRVNKLFKNPEWFGLPANPWGIRVPTSSLRGKRLKLARKMYLQ